MEFPTNDEDIIALARKMIAGLTEHPDWFPSPPVSAAELSKMLDKFLVAREAEAASKAVLFQTTIARDESLKKLLDAANRSVKPEADGGLTEQPILWN